MAAPPWIVSDELWELIEPLLPKVERRFRYPGRKRLPDRRALQGILFVLHTGIAWQHVPGDALAAADRPARAHRLARARLEVRSPTPHASVELTASRRRHRYGAQARPPARTGRDRRTRERSRGGHARKLPESRLALGDDQ